MSEAPKLYVNKPKKAQVKQLKGMEGQSSSAPSSSSSSSTTTSSSSKPPEVPKESFARRYKFLWPLLLTVNLAVGAYLFMRTKKKDATIEDETTGAASSTLATSATPPSTAVTESPTAALPIIAQPLTAVDPIPAEQQRELFKWMLEEKRKIKTKDPEEKKKIDEEKAILKQFIRAKSIPSI